MSTASRVHILLDQGLPRDAAAELRAAGLKCTHVGEIGMSASADTEILEHARSVGQIVVTLDSDFHAILAVSGASAPSVIRIEGLKGPSIAGIIRKVIAEYAPDLVVGAMITVKEQKTTCHMLRLSD